MTRIVLTLYSRRDCHLCDEMCAALEPWRARLGFEMNSVDIDGDLELIERFGKKVPVLMHDDREICHYILNESALVEYLNHIDG